MNDTVADAPKTHGEADEAPPAPLQPVDIDWRALEWAVEHGAADEPAFLHTQTGELTYLTAAQAAGLSAEQPLLRLEPLGAAEETEWMQSFVEGLDDDWPRDALVDALLLAETPRHAFEQALGRFPAERLRWLACRHERLRHRLLSWLAGHGLVVGMQGREPGGEAGCQRASCGWS